MHRLLVAFGVFAIAVATNASAAAHANVQHATVELIAEKTSFVPGEQAWVGVLIVHEPNWHTYWINPGDSGLPTKLQWRLPADFRAGEIAWPAPKRFDLGNLYNFGYDATVLLPVSIAVPTTARDGTSVTLAVDAKWLICSHEICLPGKTSLQLDVPIGKDPKSNARTAALFAKGRTDLPIAAPWSGTASIDGDRVNIELRGVGLLSGEELDVFSVVPNVIDNARPTITGTGSRIVINAARSEYFESAPATLPLVLTQRAGDRVGAWRVEVPFAVASNRR